MIVVDTNVIAYLWIPGVHTSLAEGVFSHDPVWAAPLLWRSEFRNVLAGYLRRDLMSFEIAVQLMEQAQLQMQEGEYSVSSSHVLGLVNGSSCSAYDCEFLALAEDLSIPLVTNDQKILKLFPHVAISLDSFVRGK